MAATGDLSLTLRNGAASSTGKLAIAGQTSAQLADVSGTLTATATAHAGAVAITLAPIGTTLQGVNLIRATAAPTLGVCLCSGAGVHDATGGSTLPALPVRPSSSGYAVQRSEGVVKQTAVVGGAPRSRLDQFRATSIVSVTWKVRPDDFDVLMAFWRANVASPFTADLVLDSGYVDTYVCRFVPGSVKIGGLNGGSFVVNGQFEVEPLPVDNDADNSILDMYEEYGSEGGIADILTLLDLIANHDMPGI